MQGLIDYLLSDKANSLRDYINFKVKFIFCLKSLQIIPMLNPDGVIIGNYRTGL